MSKKPTQTEADLTGVEALAPKKTEPASIGGRQLMDFDIKAAAFF